MNEVVYFELNNWFSECDYLDAEPFTECYGCMNHTYEDCSKCKK